MEILKMLKKLETKYGVAKLLTNWKTDKHGIFVHKVSSEVEIIDVELDKEIAMARKTEKDVVVKYRGDSPKIGEKFFVCMKLPS